MYRVREKCQTNSRAESSYISSLLKAGGGFLEAVGSEVAG
jgi:hypothetical protein